jgi:hypothetical protein
LYVSPDYHFRRRMSNICCKKSVQIVRCQYGWEFYRRFAMTRDLPHFGGHPIARTANVASGKLAMLVRAEGHTGHIRLRRRRLYANVFSQIFHQDGGMPIWSPAPHRLMAAFEMPFPITGCLRAMRNWPTWSYSGI